MIVWRSLPPLVGFLFVQLAVRVQATPPQQPAPERSVLDIPDSVVIEGRARYQLQTSGSKNFTYYAKAFPVERQDDPHGFTSVATLPALSSKQTYPTPVRHGAIRATQVRAVAQHYGNVLAFGNRVADLRGWLVSGDGELGGGRGHTADAGWHCEALSGRVRKVISWRTAYEGQCAFESGRTGIWGQTTPSHRTYYRADMGLGVERVIGDDHQVRLDLDFAQRGVGGPEADVGEQAFASRLTWQRASGRFWVRATGLADVVHTSRPSGKSGTGSHVVVSAEAWTRPEEDFGGALGVTVYTVDYFAGDSLRTIRPSIAAWARILDIVKFTARLSSGVDRFGVWEAYRDNPLLNLATPVRTPFRSVDIDVNGEVPITHSHVATFGMTHVVVKDYPVWVRKDTATAWSERFPNEPFVRDQFAIDYTYQGRETASITSFYGRYQHWWSGGSFNLFGVWRVHGLAGRDVPHVPGWELHFVADLPLGRGIALSPGMHAIGKRRYVRRTALDSLDTLDPYVVFDVEASVPLRQGWTFTASVQNLLDQRYQIWEGFREPGLHVQVGLKRTW